MKRQSSYHFHHKVYRCFAVLVGWLGQGPEPSSTFITLQDQEWNNSKSFHQQTYKAVQWNEPWVDLGNKQGGTDPTLLGAMGCRSHIRKYYRTEFSASIAAWQLPLKNTANSVQILETLQFSPADSFFQLSPNFHAHLHKLWKLFTTYSKSPLFSLTLKHIAELLCIPAPLHSSSWVRVVLGSILKLTEMEMQ